ncbi:unnamed protein product [Linum trigynum]|uniref:Btz domain-containing protein n=1 Tax=Linum trigynum TaxID=586398 RepID=A0AAV2GYV5_9ROSI
MARGRGRAEERGGDDGGDGSDEEDLKWCRVRRRTESSDDDGEVREDNDDPSVSSAGAEFGDDSDGLGAAPEPEDEASPYYFDELGVGDGEDEDEGEGASRTVEFAAMAAERQMRSEGEEDKEQSERDRKEREAVAVPRSGAFFMHDDRTSHRGRGRQNYGAGRLIEHDEGKWQHDKFEEIQGSYDKKAMDHKSSRIVRGRGPIKYPLARPYSRYPPKENEKAWMSRETRSNSGRVLAEASSQVGSSALKKEVSASYVNCASRMDNPTISTFSHAISSLTKRDVQKRNTEGDSPKSVLSKTDPSMETAFASRLVRGLGDSTGRDQRPSNELIRENNLESVQWQGQGQGTGLPFAPQHTYQHPATSPNGGALMINNHVLPQTSFNNSFPPYFGGCSPEYTLFGSPSRALLPSASEIGTLFVSAGLNTELIRPAADRQLAFLPLQPVMTWSNSPQSLQWNLSPSPQHVYQYTGSNQNGGALMVNNLVIPQTPFGNSFQPQFHGYGQHLYSPSGSSSVFDNSEMAMAGSVSAADGSYGRTYSGLDTHTNQNFTTTENLVPVNQVTSQHHGEFGEIGISNVPAYFAAEPNFGSSASGLAWPQVWPANAGSVSSAYPSSTYPTPTTSANRRAKPTEPESSLAITGSVTTQFVNFHEGSNPVDGSEMPNTSRGEGGNKLQRYTKMNFDDRRK